MLNVYHLSGIDDFPPGHGMENCFLVHLLYVTLLCNQVAKVTFVFYFVGLKKRPAQKTGYIMNLGTINGYAESSLKFNEDMQAKMDNIYSIRTAYRGPGQCCTRLFTSH